MGIDFSHGNARWSYGGFHRFRERLVRSLGIERPLMEIFDDNDAPEWEALKKSPMYRFIDHSDSDGLELLAGMRLAVSEKQDLEFM